MMTEKEKMLYRKTYGDKALEKLMKGQRGVNGMNTGTRTHKSKRDYDRKREKELLRQAEY